MMCIGKGWDNVDSVCQVICQVVYKDDCWFLFGIAECGSLIV